ncbi:hypothetical protein [Xanthomonas axonopodis]
MRAPISIALIHASRTFSRVREQGSAFPAAGASLVCISRIFFLRARERQCKGMHPWSGFFRRCARWVEQHSAYDLLSIR